MHIGRTKEEESKDHRGEFFWQKLHHTMNAHHSPEGQVKYLLIRNKETLLDRKLTSCSCWWPISFFYKHYFQNQPSTLYFCTSCTSSVCRSSWLKESESGGDGLIVSSSIKQNQSERQFNKQYLFVPPTMTFARPLLPTKGMIISLRRCRRCHEDGNAWYDNTHT